MNRRHIKVVEVEILYGLKVLVTFADNTLAIFDADDLLRMAPIRYSAEVDENGDVQMTLRATP